MKELFVIVQGNPLTIAALEQAMLDTCGKLAGKPIYGMFGATNQPIPFDLQHQPTWAISIAWVANWPNK